MPKCSKGCPVCCNSHEKLLAAAEAALQAHRLNRKQIFGTDALEEQLRAAIREAKAGGE